MFVWLGSGRARRNGVGLKGRLLDEAARARLPVPGGAIVLDAFYRFACREGLVVERDGRPEIPDPPYLSNTLYYGMRLPRFNRPVIIRPAFSQATPQADVVRPKKQSTNAMLNGKKHPSDTHRPANFLSSLEVALPAHDRGLTAVQIVDPNDPTEFALAFGRVWSTVPLDGNWRRDTLIMDMIQANTLATGTAVTDDIWETDRLSYHGEEAADVVVQLPKLSGWQRPGNTLPSFARRLQQLLRGVRRTFGRGGWTIDWVGDGEICWLVTIYPTDAA
jgi:hypothetical protein